jgi:hypothetical protein
MSNTLSPLTPSVFGQSLFVATVSGAIVDPVNGNSIRAGIVVLNNSSSPLTLTLAAPLAGAADAGRTRRHNPAHRLGVQATTSSRLPVKCD